ncbi:MAG TPA: ABC transporter permease [Hyphomicrobiales bacterium]|nr:ABC transporter permease [Hyphomicrobiales bacterium]
MLFDILESLRAALQSIRAHGFRSFLTTLGIIIGVAAVIATVALIQGFSFTVNQQFEALGTNSLTVQSYTPLTERLQGRIARITPDDVELIAQRVDGIAWLTPILYAQASGINQVRYGSQATATQIFGSTYTYSQVGNIYMRAEGGGRFLSDSDNLTRRRVAVIGDDVRKNLSLPNDPVGEFIRIGEEWVKVIGLVEPRGQILGQNQDNFVVLPFNTMRSLMGNQVQPDIFVQLTVSDIAQMDTIQQRIQSLLRDAHNLTTEDDDFQVQSSEQLAATFNTILGSVTLVMGGIVGISLLVGGIGIMNIMLVSVTERTKEIGICKAIGAKRHQILLQFLFESLLLCLLGGLVGLVIGYGIGAAVSAVIPGFPAAVVPFWAVLLAFGFSALVGLLFGIMPAAKAANLDPIVALRYE